MPIVNNLVYEPYISEFSSEEDVIKVLEDVRINISSLDKNFLKNSLRQVLEVVDNGYSDFLKNGIVNRVDFSKTLEMFQQYRRLSEPGCQSCQHYETFMPEGEADTTKSYCGLSETELDIQKGAFSSPVIHKNFNKGCDVRVPVFKPLEEVLTHAD